MNLYNMNKWPVGFANPQAASAFFEFLKAQVGAKILLTENGLRPATGVSVNPYVAQSAVPYSMLSLDGSTLSAVSGCSNAVASSPVGTGKPAAAKTKTKTDPAKTAAPNTCAQQQALTQELTAYLLDEIRPLTLPAGCVGRQDATRSCIVCGGGTVAACPALPGTANGGPTGPGGSTLPPGTPQTPKDKPPIWTYESGYADDKDCPGFDVSAPPKGSFAGTAADAVSFSLHLRTPAKPASADTTGPASPSSPTPPLSMRLSITLEPLVAQKPNAKVQKVLLLRNDDDVSIVPDKEGEVVAGPKSFVYLFKGTAGKCPPSSIGVYLADNHEEYATIDDSDTADTDLDAGTYDIGCKQKGGAVTSLAQLTVTDSSADPAAADDVPYVRANTKQLYKSFCLNKGGFLDWDNPDKSDDANDCADMPSALADKMKAALSTAQDIKLPLKAAVDKGGLGIAVTAGFAKASSTKKNAGVVSPGDACHPLNGPAGTCQLKTNCKGTIVNSPKGGPYYCGSGNLYCCVQPDRRVAQPLPLSVQDFSSSGEPIATFDVPASELAQSGLSFAAPASSSGAKPTSYTFAGQNQGGEPESFTVDANAKVLVTVFVRQWFDSKELLPTADSGTVPHEVPARKYCSTTLAAINQHTSADNPNGIWSDVGAQSAPGVFGTPYDLKGLVPLPAAKAPAVKVPANTQLGKPVENSDLGCTNLGGSCSYAKNKKCDLTKMTYVSGLCQSNPATDYVCCLTRNLPGKYNLKLYTPMSSAGKKVVISNSIPNDCVKVYGSNFHCEDPKAENACMGVRHDNHCGNGPLKCCQFQENS